MDEVHSYVGELGSEVACLLRRLKLVVPHPKTSPSLAPLRRLPLRDEEPENGSKRFGSRLFGVEQDDIRLVTESYIELEREPDEYVPLFPRDPGEILKEMVYEVSSQIPEDGETAGILQAADATYLQDHKQRQRLHDTEEERYHKRIAGAQSLRFWKRLLERIRHYPEEKMLAMMLSRRRYIPSTCRAHSKRRQRTFTPPEDPLLRKGIQT